MASNLRVDTILPSSGTNVAIGTASGTVSLIGDSNLTTSGNLTIGGNLGVGGTLTYEDVTNIDSVGVITARSGIRIGATGANSLIAGNATGISLGTGTARQKLHINASDSGAANMVFTNATTGTAAGDGFVVGITGGEDAQLNMQESANLKFSTADTERLRIGSAGQLGIAGANYGTSGQVLTSQGSGSAIQWATPAAGWVHGTETALNGNVTLIKNGVPDGASHIRYLFRYVSTNNTAQPYVQVEYNNNGTIKTSNYQTCSVYVRNLSAQVAGDSDKSDGLQLWYGYTNAGNVMHGVLDIYRIGTSGTDGTNYYMDFRGLGISSSNGYDGTHSAQGYFEIGTGSTDYVSGIKISTQNGSVQFDNGYIQQSYLLS